MTDVIGLKVCGVEPSEWIRCQKVARQFLEEFPDKLGIRNGCIYHAQGLNWPMLYVYRTKTMVIVRGSK